MFSIYSSRFQKMLFVKLIFERKTNIRTDTFHLSHYILWIFSFTHFKRKSQATNFSCVCLCEWGRLKVVLLIWIWTKEKVYHYSKEFHIIKLYCLPFVMPRCCNSIIPLQPHTSLFLDSPLQSSFLWIRKILQTQKYILGSLNNEFDKITF